MSIGIAVKNAEGAVLVTDTLCSLVLAQGHELDVIEGKPQWIRGFRIAAFVMPVRPATALLVDEPVSGGRGEDLVPTVRRLYSQAATELDRNFHLVSSSAHRDWATPHLLVAGYLDDGPTLLRIENDELEQVASPGAVRIVGGWNELGDGEERLASVDWSRATTVRAAADLAADVMLRYIAAYETQVSVDRRVGGPVDVTTITRDEIRIERRTI